MQIRQTINNDESLFKETFIKNSASISEMTLDRFYDYSLKIGSKRTATIKSVLH